MTGTLDRALGVPGPAGNKQGFWPAEKAAVFDEQGSEMYPDHTGIIVTMSPPSHQAGLARERHVWQLPWPK
jgi:hypothetical protein